MSVIVWSSALVAFLVIGFVLVAAVKKRMRDDDVSAPGAAAGFSLSDLRQLHRQGQISDDEFERAKEKIIGAAKKGARANALKPPEEEIAPP
ncbi:MAG TPA: SHOCT domain-containing protein [Tepidisphaeraceae bacterium]|nr:SHOCT domain-containing protein [Tepidisphaeraceae bacterium]